MAALTDADKVLRNDTGLAIVEKLEDIADALGGESIIDDTTSSSTKTWSSQLESTIVGGSTYNSSSIADKTNLLRDTALEAMRLHGTDTTRRMYFTEYSANAPQDIFYCVAVPSKSEGEYIKHLPELKALSFFHHGAYEEIPEARKRLLSYAEENNLTLTGVFRNIYLEGPPQHKDKSKFITQIIAIIE